MLAAGLHVDEPAQAHKPAVAAESHLISGTAGSPGDLPASRICFESANHCFRVLETDPPSSPTTTTARPTRSTVSTLASKVVIKPNPPKPTTPLSLPPETVPPSLSSGLTAATQPERNYLGCIANFESRGQLNAYNPDGPYFSKYQFLQSTWDGFVTSIGKSGLRGVNIRLVPEADQDFVALNFLRAGRRHEWGTNAKCAHYLG